MIKIGLKKINRAIIVMLSTILMISTILTINVQAATVNNVVSEASKHIGKSYQWGGTGPDAFDCSGFTQYVFNQVGVYLPRVTTAQVGYGTEISYGNLQEGDLVFFDNTYDGSNPTHVGIYVGNGTMIHCGDNGVEYKNISSGYWRDHYSTARRL